MRFDAVKVSENVGFKGFKTIGELMVNQSSIPDVRGVYQVFFQGDKPRFLATGTGGFFKGKDPNVSIEELKGNWVDGVPVVYIGKAGGTGSSATLRSRLKQYLRFGQGKNVGHWGGRLIWQIENSQELLICWKELPIDEPREVEIDLIQEFVSKYGQRPFANLAD